jgi:cyclophilin family peptidyl-prolyl cis-trans isomerase
MLRFSWNVLDLFGRWKARRSRLRKRFRASQGSTDLEHLEPRTLLTGGPSLVKGVAFIDGDLNGAKDNGEKTASGIPVTLTGAATGNPDTTVTLNATTDINGAFTFRSVLPGTYQITAEPGANLQGSTVEVPEFAVSDEVTVTKNVALRGIKPEFLSLRQFLTNTTEIDFSQSRNGPFATPGASSNHQPSLLVAQPAETVVAVNNTTGSVVDLAGTFTDSDITNSRVRLDISGNDINVDLLDTEAPQTVANFFNYVTSDRYDNTIFHRLAFSDPNNTPGNPNDDVPFVLQGGGYHFDAAASDVIKVEADPPVKNEFDGTTRSNVDGTIAMAKLGGNPNSATSEFFFNLGDNSANLNGQNGGFTVFARLAATEDRAVLTGLQATPREDHGSPVDNIPLNEYTGSSFRTSDVLESGVLRQFHTDAQADNFLLLRDVTVLKRDESLSYSIVSNSNQSLFTKAEIENNRLVLEYAANQTGIANIVIRATDSLGASRDATFPIVVGNRAPSATVTLAANPSPATTASTLTATATKSDPDPNDTGDAVRLTYVWKVNNTVVKTTAGVTALTDTLTTAQRGAAVAGDVITVEVTPNDGEVDGQLATDSVMLG